MTVWDDLAARARGLATHLLNEAELERIEGTADRGGLASILAASGYAPHLTSARPSPEGVEEALRGRVARDLALLARWAGPARRRALSIVFEEDERTSLRILVRGVALGLPSRMRLRGTVPTPALPAERLREAAEASSLPALARRLEAWEHPLAPVLTDEAGRARPDLYRLEVELFRAWARRAVGPARKEGGALRDFVQAAVDAWNVRTAVARVRSPAGGGETLFVEGGRWLGEEDFREAVEADGPEEASARLDRALAGTPFRVLGRRSGSLEEELLERRLERAARRVRTEPVGPGPVLVFTLRLRREVWAIRRAAWGVALEAPASLRTSRTVGGAADASRTSEPETAGAGRGRA